MDEFEGDIEMTGEGTPGATGYFEVSSGYGSAILRMAIADGTVIGRANFTMPGIKTPTNPMNHTTNLH